MCRVGNVPTWLCAKFATFVCPHFFQLSRRYLTLFHKITSKSTVHEAEMVTNKYGCIAVILIRNYCLIVFLFNYFILFCRRLG